MPLHGECNCSSIKVMVADQPPEKAGSINCLCSNCRRQSGGLGTFIMLIDDADVTVEGQPKVYMDMKADSGKPLERWFCGECGRYSVLPPLIVLS